MSELSLKDFIEQSLVDICEAVDSARQKHDYIAPRNTGVSANKDFATNVEFDVAVTVTEQHADKAALASEAGAGVKLSVFSAKASVTSEGENTSSKAAQHENRIKFSVPVYFQYDKNKRSTIIPKGH